MNKLLRVSLLMLLPAVAVAGEAEDSTAAPAENRRTEVQLHLADADAASCPENVISIQPTGRILMDGAAYASDDDRFKAGVAFPDIRIGVKARYGKWRACIDVGYAFDKVSLKDVYLQYDFSPAFMLRAGSFIHQFTLQSASSSSMKISMEEPTSNEAFNFPRLIGLMGVYDKGEFFGSLSLNVESKAIKKHANELGKTGWGGLSRLVWRPVDRKGSVAQIGMSLALQSAQYNDDPALNHRSVGISANFPTRVNSVSAIDALVTDARNSFRFSPELLLAVGRVALESQYYHMRVNRHDGLEAFTAWGAYGMLRGLLKGDCYSYSHADAALATPAPKSLELVLLYNHTTLSDAQTGIYGGRVNDISLTANWYINKYIIWRLRAGYTHRWDRDAMPDVDLGAFQTRLQIIF